MIQLRKRKQSEGVSKPYCRLHNTSTLLVQCSFMFLYDHDNPGGQSLDDAAGHREQPLQSTSFNTNQLQPSLNHTTVTRQKVQTITHHIECRVKRLIGHRAKQKHAYTMTQPQLLAHFLAAVDLSAWRSRVHAGSGRRQPRQEPAGW
jgi:hypothetical protein